MSTEREGVEQMNIGESGDIVNYLENCSYVKRWELM
jgi:hypothetical protein